MLLSWTPSWVRWPQNPLGLKEPGEGLASVVAAPQRRGPTCAGMSFVLAPPFPFCELSVSPPVFTCMRDT